MVNRLFGVLLALVLSGFILGAAPPEGDTGSGGGYGSQAPGFGFPQAQTAPQYGDSRDKVSITARAGLEKVAPGTEQIVAVIFDIAKGWHIWTNQREIPDTYDKFEFAQFTTITVASKSAGAIDAEKVALQWPDFHGVTVNYGLGDETYAFFENRVIAYAVVPIPSDAPVGNVTIQVEVYLQSCDASTCLAPATATAQASFEIVSDLSAVTMMDIREDPDFAAFDPAKLDIAGAGENNNNGGAAPDTNDSQTGGETAAPPVTAAPPPSFFGIDLPRAEGALGLLLIAIMSILGGFILNLTPCVLPIIPIKIMTISSHANTPHRSLVLGWWMAIGVVAFWVAIGLPVIMFRSFTDPSRIFGIWWLTAGIGALIGLMGIGIMGLFTIRLPSAVYAVNPKAETAWGSFVFGVMTAILGLPCFGFVAGALLAGTATLPAFTIMTIFTCLGIGMAAPYLVLSAKPGLVEKIPRTGPGSELVKQVMGLLLLAAAAYFIGSGLIALSSDHPYIGEQLPWWAVALFAVLAGVWLIYRTVQITHKPIPRIVFAAMGLVIGGAAVLYAIDSTAKARETYLTRKAAIEAAGVDASYVPGIWNDYSPTVVAKARADGKIVVLDFTATWCLTCKALKAAVLNRNPVKEAFAADDVVTFTVDLTSTKAPGWNLLRDELGQTGIPLLVIYTPGKEEPWLQNAYTSDQVMDALAEARNAQALARQNSIWEEYSPEAVEAARADGQVVVLDFDAEWLCCSGSPSMKRRFLLKESIATQTSRNDVALFNVDVTRSNSAGWKLLAKLGQKGVPVLAIYSPAIDEPTISNSYHPDEVMNALNQARSTLAPARR